MMGVALALARGYRLMGWITPCGDKAVEVAAAWEADGYTTRIKKRRAA